MNAHKLAAVLAAAGLPSLVSANGSFDGFYVGAHGGAAFVNETKVDYPNPPNWEGGRKIEIDDESGFTGGAQLGFNWQRDKLVFGVEADLSYLNYDGSGTAGNPLTDTVYEASADWLGTLRARIGYAFDDKSLVYATGGLAFSDLNYEPNDGTSVDVEQFVGDEDADTGWTVGAGFERQIKGNLSLKAEYLYVRFDGERVTADTIPTGLPPTLDFDFDDTEMHIFRVGVNYRF